MKQLHWALTTAAVLAASIGVSYGWAHGGKTDAIHACVAKDGSLRITADPTDFGDATTGCDDAAGEHALDWNLQGAQGAEGAAGPQGAPGAPGKDAQLDPQARIVVSRLVTREQARLAGLRRALTECMLRRKRLQDDLDRKFPKGPVLDSLSELSRKVEAQVRLIKQQSRCAEIWIAKVIAVDEASDDTVEEVIRNLR